ncbi:Hpt domain-containing protein [Colwellia sp. MB3u-4]|uniref:Hpt domain-containing protein n=1 Tax=Colwellia sp. MB3u-4 TaxID=2759822 RepID=UPI0015F48276|nr:Hpt domain-containing protein [Colwellia sp. MB3u-4]MBA6289265.1 Hpt domain-containing protein [Colwellia sp. MB3u-4]
MEELIDQSIIKQMTTDLGQETCFRLVQLFIDEMTDLHSKLNSAFNSENTNAIGDITHIIKNSAALYGAMQLSDKATEINNRLTIFNQPLVSSDNIILSLMANTLLQYNDKYN